MSLNGPGFTLVHHDTKVSDFYNDTQVRTKYYAEAESLCKKLTGAAHCKVMMGHRRSLTQKTEKYTKRPGYGLVAHCDFQAGFDDWFAGVLDGRPAPGYEWQNDGDRYDDELVRKEWEGFTGDDVRQAAGVLVVHLWRNISDEPIQSAPLAVVDGRSISTDDMVMKRIVRRADGGGKLTEDTPFEYAMQGAWLSRLMYNPEQKWYYYPEQRHDEVLAFKTFDSNSPANGQGIAYNPHSAFLLDNFHEKPLRESIEVRIICLLPPKHSTSTNL
jgi:hypothetical protein